MPTITPPPPPPPPPPQGGTPPAPPVVVVQNPPAAVTQLNLGHVLEAAIAARVGKDLYTLRTPLGPLTVQTTMALPKLANLVLLLQTLTPQAQFIIDTINGKPPVAGLRPAAVPSGSISADATPTGQVQSASLSNAASQAALKAPGSVTLSAGTTVKAHLLRPLTQPPGNQPPATETTATPTPKTTATPTPKTATTPTPKTATTSGPQATIAKGLQKSIVNSLGKGLGKLAARALPIAKAATGASPTGVAAKATSPGTAKVAQTARATGATATSSQNLTAGSQFKVKIVTINLPSTTANDATQVMTKPANSGLSVGRSLTGTVTGNTTSGHPVVQTSSGAVIALQTQSALPKGSIVTLQITSTPTPPKIDTAMQIGGGRDNPFISRSWPALEETVITMHKAAPAVAQQLVQTVLPQPGPALTATVLFFLTALRGGNLRNWIGDTQIRSIERARPNLLGRMRDDFQQLGRIAEEPSPGDWRVALIPVNTGEALEQIRMLMRRGGDGEEDDADQSKTRFIIDVVLTDMGRIQLDGLVGNDGKRLDLIVRSDTPLASYMHNDIQNIFHKAAEASGLTGGVNFQATPPNFIEVEDPVSDGETGLVV